MPNDGAFGTSGSTGMPAAARRALRSAFSLRRRSSSSASEPATVALGVAPLGLGADFDVTGLSLAIVALLLASGDRVVGDLAHAVDVGDRRGPVAPQADVDVGDLGAVDGEALRSRRPAVHALPVEQVRGGDHGAGGGQGPRR